MRYRTLLLSGVLAAGMSLTMVPGTRAVSVEADPGERISRALAVDQRIRTEDEKQQSLDRDRENARAQRHEDIRYYWWWPFRR